MTVLRMISAQLIYLIQDAVLSQEEPRGAAVNFDTRIEFYNKSITERLCTLNTAT